MTGARKQVMVLALALVAFSGAMVGGCAGGGGVPLLTAAVTPEPAAESSIFPTTGEGDESKTRDVPLTPFGDGPTSATGGRVVIANPTPADVMQPGPLPEMAWGREDAPVTLVEYASLTCRHCRKFHMDVFPVLKREYIDTGRVRYILREFPIGKTSGHATIALRCAKPAKYLDLFGKYLAQQESWVSQEVRLEPIFKVAAQVGLTQAEFDACLKDQALINGLKAIKDRGRTLGIIGTPNFFVNGKLVKKTLDADGLREIIDPLLAAPAPQAAVAKP